MWTILYIFLSAYRYRFYSTTDNNTAINDSGDTAANDAFVFNYVRNRYGSTNDVDEVKIGFLFLKHRYIDKVKVENFSLKIQVATIP